MEKCFFIVFVYLSFDIAIADEDNINEGHLYHVEIEEQKIKSEELKAILESDKLKVWSNCFSDNEGSEHVNKNEN